VLRKPSLKSLAMLMTVASVAAASVLSAPAPAAAAQRIDMKVLLLGTSNTDPDFLGWQGALQREGVPFEAIVTTPGHAPITAATLSSTLSNGTQEGKYQGIIVSVGQLPECTESGCFSTLSTSEWSALEEYEQTFNVRRLSGDIYPGSTYGLESPTSSGALEGSLGSLTSAGKTVFPYLNGPVGISAGTYGYEAIPLATQVAGASFEPLVSGPGGSALVGIYTHPDGVQEMVQTFNQNQYQLQAELLRHGVLNWVTRGVYFGEQRNYVEMDIDDTFSPDDAWSIATHQNEYTNFASALRMRPQDVPYAANWSEANHFRMEQLFNGGNSVVYQEEHPEEGHPGPDPLLAEFQKTDPNTGKPYAASFGWLSHTYDTPVMDVGCATQNYIEAELNENTSWAAAAPGATPGTGGLGLTETTELFDPLGTENPHVFVPGNHSGFADLVPGNPATVDPPEFNSSVVNEHEGGGGGTLPAGTYEYAITDQFTDSPSAGQTTASVTTPLEVKAGDSVTLQWQSICHASDFLVYREIAGSNKWSLVDTVATPQSATLPDNSSGETESKSTTDVKGGGELEQTFVDNGVAGTAEPAGWAPPAVNAAVESGWEQNPYFIPALEAVGITAVGDDASKGYPDPPETPFGVGVNYTGPEYQAGETYRDGSAQVVPRHPINVYYNASTEAQEVSEYNWLYMPPPLGECVNTSTTTCEAKEANFAEIVNSVVSGMFQNMMNNDPRPSYVHQTNLLGEPPAGPATTGTPPNTPDTTGDGLLYSVLNPLLAEYNEYFASTAPYEQLTLGAIANVLAEQKAWSKASAGQVSGYIEGNQVTVDNSGTEAVSTPLTGVTSVGSSYGGIQSGWTSAAAGNTVYTAATSWPAVAEPVQKEPQGSWVGKVGSAGYLLADWDGVQDFSDMPNVTASLVEGSRYEWAASSTEARALQGPEGTNRAAAAYYATSQLQVNLSFASAYSGNLHLYAVDWDKQGRRESIVVNDGSGPREVVIGSEFSEGAWVSFPISVAAGGTVTITVNKTAGPNAVLSGVFLGGEGAPPVTTGQELSKGGWVGAVGSAGYDLAAWDGTAGDLSNTPGVTVGLVRGSRYLWAADTTDPRALSEANQLTRNAAAYYDSTQIQVSLGFSAAYSGTLHLYAVDWDTTARRETITVDGQTATLSSSFHEGAWVSFPISVAANGTVTITVDKTAGPNAVLSGIFIGGEGSPPTTTVPAGEPQQGTWTGRVGSAGYLLPDWDGVQDLSDMPGVSTSLVQGSRYSWATSTTETRGLQGPEGLTRSAAAYYDATQLEVNLDFSAAYSGTLHLYALDWDSTARRETITVDGQTATLSSSFHEGAWVSFPITVAAGETITITVNKTAGANAVLSGIFLGGEGSPPAMTVASAPQGSWVGTYGSVGYDLAGWEASADLSSLTDASLSLAQGSRYEWATGTTEARALEGPEATTRNAAAYYNSTQVRVLLSFSAAFSGTLHLYALDWDSTARRETITVDGQTATLSSSFHEGAWVSFPVTVAAGGTVTITVDKTAGANAVLSGIFLE
jgi:hypothetical protein